MTGPVATGPVGTRPVVPDDEPFLVALYAATLADELGALGRMGWDEDARRTFVEQQYQARRAAWASVVPPLRDDVVLVGDRPVGRVVVERRVDRIRVVDVAIVPEARGQGTGAAVLSAVLAEADAAGLHVSLHVYPGNRAAHLYERLGFRVTGDTDAVPLLMRRPAAPGGSVRPG